jgi:hypothetical protein
MSTSLNNCTYDNGGVSVIVCASDDGSPSHRSCSSDGKVCGENECPSNNSGTNLTTCLVRSLQYAIEHLYSTSRLPWDILVHFVMPFAKGVYAKQPTGLTSPENLALLRVPCAPATFLSSGSVYYIRKLLLCYICYYDNIYLTFSHSTSNWSFYLTTPLLKSASVHLSMTHLLSNLYLYRQ